MPDAQTCTPQLARQLAPSALRPWVRAHLVDGRGLGRVGAAGAKGDLPRGTLPNATLEHVAKVDVLDVLRLDAGLGEDALDGRDSELDGRDLGEHALERADGCAGLRSGSVRAQSGSGRATHSSDDEDCGEVRRSVRGRLQGHEVSGGSSRRVRNTQRTILM